jgi:hypothetical protein
MKLFNEFIEECKEVANGRRGWVACSKVRAERMGLQFGSLKVVAEQLGLVIRPHGKYGYTAIRKF